MREHWPPAKPPKGQTQPVLPDHRNAISVSGGYQYQNVLAEDLSIKLVKTIGNVVHAFSGDDHDYCEVTHAPNQGSVPEITVKSISMAMGVPSPGFLMVSMYNPIDAAGNKLAGAPPETMQTHLCLLPNQLSTYSRYGLAVFLSLAVLAVRAFLVPVFKLQPFALDPEPSTMASLLPMFKAKVEDYDANQNHGSGASGFTAASSSLSKSRDRGQSFSPATKHNGTAAEPKHKGRHLRGPERWGWGRQLRPGPQDPDPQR